MLENLRKEVDEYRILQRTYKILVILILNYVVWFIPIFTFVMFGAIGLNFGYDFANGLFYLCNAIAIISTMIIFILLIVKNITEIIGQIWLISRK